MAKKAIIILACLMQVFPAFSQASVDSLQQRYDREAIYLAPRFWRGMTFVQNGVGTSTGGYLNRLNKVMSVSPEASAYLHKARQQVYVQQLVGIVPIGFLLHNEINGLNREQTYEDDIRDLRTLGFCLTFSVLVEAPIKYKTHQLLHQATWLYNRDVLFGANRPTDFVSPLLDRYNQQTIYLKPTQLSGMKYVKGGKTLNATYFSGNLANEFERTPSARFLYDQAVKNRRTSRTAGVSAVVAHVTGIALMLSAIRDIDSGPNPNEGRAVAKALGGVGLSLLGSGLMLAVQTPLTFKSERQLAEAVHLHNREVLFFGAEH